MNQGRIAEPNPWERREDEYDPLPFCVLTLSDEERRRFFGKWPTLPKGPVMVEWTNE